MPRWVLTLVFLCLAPWASLSAQTDDLDKLNPLSSNPGGLRLQNVTGFFGYYSAGFSGYGSSVVSPGGATQAGGSATLGYSWLAERSGVSVTYTPTFVRSFQNSGFSTSTHNLSINWHRSATPRLSYGLTLSGYLTSLSEALVGTASVPDGQNNTPGSPLSQGTSLTTLFY